MGKKDLMELALAATTKNIVKARGASGRKTYLDRFVGTLLDADGNPVEPMERKAIIARISLDIAIEQRDDEIAAGVEGIEAFGSAPATTEGLHFSDEDAELFATLNNKVKNQVAAAVSDSQNATALSFNEQYKNVWVVVKHTGGLVSLQAK
jgi:hypothetical protein